MIVIVPVSDNTSPGEFASDIPLFANLAAPLDMDEPDSGIIGNQILYVRAVRQNQQFSVRIRLRLPARDRLR